MNGKGRCIVTLPPTFIQRERDSGFEFCLFWRVGQRGLARSFAGCAASAPLRGEGLSEPSRRLPAEAGVRAFDVIILVPGRERGAGVVQGREQRLVQQLVAQTAIEALDEGVSRVGLPGAMRCQSIFRSSAKVRIAFEVNSVPLSLTTVAGLPRASNSVAGSRTTLAPESEVSAISARHSRGQSSTTVMIRKRRLSVSWSETKYGDPRWFGISGSAIGARVPMARLRPPRRRTCSRSLS